MSEATSSPASGSPDPVPGTPASERDELQTALFLDLVAQHANLALIFLGQIPHPETGKRIRELETARHFVDQLEMLETKTRGNLNKREETLLKQSLMAARMAFVAAVEHPPESASPRSASQTTAAPAEPNKPAPAGAAPATGVAPGPASQAEVPASTSAPAPGAPASSSPDDERKKFVKKY